MANRLVWEDRFNIGVEQIDREHRKLFRIMNKLFTFSEEEHKSLWGCHEGIKYFKEHAIRHFEEEEAYMESISYQELETHIRLHEDFRLRTLPALERELERSEYSKEAVRHFLGVCAGWLIGHTLTEDHAIVENGTGKWANLQPEEEQDAVSRIIVRLLDDMFQLRAQLICGCYGGEKFGNGIYYRLTYDAGGGRQREVILVFEEKLLVDTIGKMLGDQSDTLNDMMMNAARYTARHFAERIRKRFPHTVKYILTGENLLTYEQFERTFESRLPQYSLLYDTGAGYFAYCAMTPQKQESEGAFIRPEEEMKEIREYLKENEKKQHGSGKKKLLVVDDSDLIRQAMKGLLQQDYQVTLAGSGISAIRCMTLEQPDLVLLDYNMPVCDGAQVLQMIRSEKAFEDIPVIFLTGRVDRDGISRVLPLKPQGYLLKSAKAPEIKKSIDAYFQTEHGEVPGGGTE